MDKLQVGQRTEEWSFPPPTQDKLKEGMLFLSGGTTLKGFGKAAGIPSATWASGGTANTADLIYWWCGFINKYSFSLWW